MIHKDIIVIGAGAAGMMCAIEAGKRGRSVVILDHANKAGKKILMSGGGRCNFTNYDIQPEKYLSNNPHFCKSALSRYTQWDFITLVKKHNIPFHEKTKGQLFCDGKSSDILNLLFRECDENNVVLQLKTSVLSLKKLQSPTTGFHLSTNNGEWTCESLVIATGGLSIPTMGATPFGYHVAKQFDIAVHPTRAGLVPLTLHLDDKEKLSALAGISIDCVVATQKTEFEEALLFTHRGLSGPAILQLSSYWHPGEPIRLNLLPSHDTTVLLKEAIRDAPQQRLKTTLSEYLPKRLVITLLDESLANRKLCTLSQTEQTAIANLIHRWALKPNGTEGYRTAEVTLGGVDCDMLSSQTMETKKVKGLYFIGEVQDVSGWLGGYNFQWAWASGWAAGQVV
jgi:predicted Rossmann fold flavoprotein